MVAAWIGNGLVMPSARSAATSDGGTPRPAKSPVCSRTTGGGVTRSMRSGRSRWTFSCRSWRSTRSGPIRALETLRLIPALETLRRPDARTLGRSHARSAAVDPGARNAWADPGARSARAGRARVARRGGRAGDALRDPDGRRGSGARGPPGCRRCPAHSWCTRACCCRGRTGSATRPGPGGCAACGPDARHAGRTQPSGPRRPATRPDAHVRAGLRLGCGARHRGGVGCGHGWRARPMTSASWPCRRLGRIWETCLLTSCPRDGGLSFRHASART